MAQPVDKKTKAYIDEAVKTAVQAGKVAASSTAKDAYHDTERRLYALPDLARKVEQDKESLDEMIRFGPRERSKSIVRFQRTGYRATPEEMYEAILRDLEATIAADEHEIDTMRRALANIEDDPYYLTVKGKYMDAMTDEGIANSISCDQTTVWRNRKRLVQRLAVLLYGAAAI